MSERLDSIRAVSMAADELLRACWSRPRSFRQSVNQTASEPTPSEFKNLLCDIDVADRKAKRHARRD